ncbi:MAG: c-type cytochrome [Betaproteobacteria bacterium]
MPIAFFASCAAAQAPAAPPEREQACIACHGPEGNSATPGTPSIAGQPRIYLENTLVLTREGLRGNAVMQALLKGVPDPEIIAIAKHYAARPVRYHPSPPDKALQKHGAQVAGRLRCASCHDKTFRGREQMPRLAAQREEFLEARMLTLRDKPPPGTDTIMAATLYGVSNADIKALAHFLAHLR